MQSFSYAKKAVSKNTHGFSSIFVIIYFFIKRQNEASPQLPNAPKSPPSG